MEATGRLGGPGSCAHIRVASSSENLPLLIKSGGLMEEIGNFSLNHDRLCHVVPILRYALVSQTGFELVPD